MTRKAAKKVTRQATPKSAPGRRNRTWGIAGLVFVIAGGTAAYLLGVALPTRRLLAAMPAVEAAGMEPQVAARLEAVRAAAVEEPRSAAAWGRLGQAFHAHDLLPQAIASYAQAMALEPDDFRWPYLTALAETEIDTASAIPHFQRAAALRPNDAALHIRFGDALTELGRLDKAQAEYERASAADDASSHALYGLGQVAWLKGDADTAEAHLKRAAQLAPAHGEVHTLLSQIYQRRGDVDRAREETGLARTGVAQSRPRDATVEAMEAAAVNSRALTDRGVRLAREHKYAEAEALFRQVLAIRPGNVRDHANLGGVLVRQGRAEEALEHFQQAVRLAPDDVDALSGLGTTLTTLGRHQEAATHLATALSIDPNASGARHNLGRVRYAEGKALEAIAHYRDAVRTDPGNGGAHSDLAVALADQGQLDEAAEHWQRAVQLDRFDLASRLSLSLARTRQGRHTEAIGLLREGLSLAPNSSRFVSLLAWELATAPRRQDRNGAEAVLLARRVYDSRPDSPEAADVLAAALAETGAFEEAASVARRGLEHADTAGESRVAQGLRQRLEAYAARRPFRQP